AASVRPPAPRRRRRGYRVLPREGAGPRRAPEDLREVVVPARGAFAEAGVLLRLVVAAQRAQRSRQQRGERREVAGLTDFLQGEESAPPVFLGGCWVTREQLDRGEAVGCGAHGCVPVSDLLVRRDLFGDELAACFEVASHGLRDA